MTICTHLPDMYQVRLDHIKLCTYSLVMYGWIYGCGCSSSAWTLSCVVHNFHMFICFLYLLSKTVLSIAQQPAGSSAMSWQKRWSDSSCKINSKCFVLHTTRSCQVRTYLDWPKQQSNAFESITIQYCKTQNGIYNIHLIHHNIASMPTYSTIIKDTHMDELNHALFGG